jgi:nucleotide-binding universal stress UspA family protein
MLAMKIISAVDGSPHASAAATLLSRIPFPGDTEVVVVNVLEDVYESAYGKHLGSLVRETLDEDRRESAKTLLKKESARLSKKFASVREELLVGHAAREITALAASENADLVTLGARGMNALERFLLGSTSEKIVRHAPCSVLVARDSSHAKSVSKTDQQPLRILVACDGSSATNESIETLAQLPLSESAEVMLLSVHSLVTSFRADILQKMSAEWRREAELARVALDAAAKQLAAAGIRNVSTRVEEASDVASEILQVAEHWHADIVMAGSNGKGAVDSFLLGSVSRRLIRHAEGSVWIVRGKHEPTT